jgi:hypothetical protein
MSTIDESTPLSVCHELIKGRGNPLFLQVRESKETHSWEVDDDSATGIRSVVEESSRLRGGLSPLPGALTHFAGSGGCSRNQPIQNGALSNARNSTQRYDIHIWRVDQVLNVDEVLPKFGATVNNGYPDLAIDLKKFRALALLKIPLIHYQNCRDVLDLRGD